jgi:SpoVK/Ycf46/Vps4 family AAA+-type ATPase
MMVANMDIGSKEGNNEKDCIEEKSCKSDKLHTNTDMIDVGYSITRSSNSESRKEDHSQSEAHIECNNAVQLNLLKEEMKQIRSDHKEEMRELRDRLSAKPKIKNKRQRNGSSNRCSLSNLDSGNQGIVDTDMMSGRTSNRRRDVDVTVEHLNQRRSDIGKAYNREPKSAQQDAPDDDNAKLRSELRGAIVQKSPNVKWEDVIGLEGVKETLKVTVMLPTLCPQLFTGDREPYKAILLYGPPGTGEYSSSLL